MLTTALLMLSAILLDRLLGEPRRFHPLVGFGRYAGWLEQRLNHSSASRAVGSYAWLLAILPALLIVTLLWSSPTLRPWVDVVVLYFAIGLQSLREHALRIVHALQSGDLALARTRVSDIVSRDTASMQTSDVARSSVESVLENGNDAVFAALFWFVLLGAPGALLYRLTNTLDAMWGYRTPRFLQFGWAAAKLDDMLNYLPARLTALSYALLGHTSSALRCWRAQAAAWDSPNAGPVMSAGAGSLQLQLGGPADYHGTTEHRPTLGVGATPQARDILRAIRLVQRSVWLWLALLLCAGALSHA